LSSFQSVELGLAQRAPLPAGQIAQPQISNPDANKPFHFVPDRIKHAPDLLINPLAQDNAQSRGPD